ncbi:hypothetical protein [Modestobacter sp. SYSU DS0290]
MPSLLPPGQPPFRALDTPRAPTPAEQRLLSGLAAAGPPELVAQADDVLVVGVCACGCSSVQLATSAAPVPEATVARLSRTGRDDVLAVSSTGRGPDGHVVSVVLHVLGGRLGELEVFDAHSGEGVAVDPAAVTGLSHPAVD